MAHGATYITYEAIDNNPMIASRVLNLFSENRIISDDPKNAQLFIVGECPLFDKPGLSWDIIFIDDDVITVPISENGYQFPWQLIQLMLEYEQRFPAS